MKDSPCAAVAARSIRRQGVTGRTTRVAFGRFHPRRRAVCVSVAGLVGSWLSLGVLLWGAGGCVGWPMAGAAAASGNPMYVAVADRDVVWERAVDTLHDFKFQIAREDRLNGTIETAYKVGAGVLEPWHPDSVRPVDRWESTFQSIRRRVRVQIMPADGTPGFFVFVEALKESEIGTPGSGDFSGPATFTENQPLARDLTAVVGEAAPEGWMALGRDAALEQAILARLVTKL